MKWLLANSLKALSWIVAVMPAWVRKSLAWALAFFWFDVLRIRRQVAILNLKKAFPHWSEKERIRCARHSVFVMTTNLVEYTLFPFFTRDQAEEQFSLKGMENWNKAVDEKRGVLFLTLHMGRGDLALAALSQRGLPLYLISKEFKSAWLNEMWFGLRAKQGTNFISYHKSAFDVLRALKKNAGVIFVLDQFMGPPSGYPVKFFGHPTGTAKGLAVMAERAGAPVLPLYTRMLPDGRNEIVIEEPLAWLDQGDKERTLQTMTQIYTDKIQQIVQKYPEQWMWIHKRWKNFA